MPDSNAITTKRAHSRRYENGEYGNKLRTWLTVADVIKTGSPTVVLRYNSSGGAKFPKYGTGVPLSEVPALVRAWKNAGAAEHMIAFNEEAPDSILTIQGEVVNDHEGWGFFCSTKPIKMRTAMGDVDTVQVRGLRALHLLRGHLSSGSFADLMELHDRFPDSVIEISAYSRSVGSIPQRNAVVWEVRNF